MALFKWTICKKEEEKTVGFTFMDIEKVSYAMSCAMIIVPAILPQYSTSAGINLRTSTHTNNKYIVTRM